MRSYILVAAAIVLPLGGVVFERSLAAPAAQPYHASEPESAATADPRQPIDADYAVPGVLDYRSWKPEYDSMPASHVASYARRTAAPSAPLATIADPAGDGQPQATTELVPPQGQDAATTAKSDTVPTDVGTPPAQL